MENTNEYCTGRIRAFEEIKELLFFVSTSDKYTVEQLKILTKHIDNQIKREEHTIDMNLELMEGCELLRR